MHWFAVIGASHKISMEKLPVLSKTLKKGYGYCGCSINSLPQHRAIY